MKILSFLIVMIISSMPCSSFAFSNGLIGVWKNADNNSQLETIEFRRNGVYLKTSDRIFGGANRELEVTSFKQKNSEIYVWKMRKSGTGEMVDIPVKFKLDKEKLILIDVLGRKKQYERLNHEEFKSYATNIKMYNKGIDGPEAKYQQDVENKASLKGNKIAELIHERKGKLGQFIEENRQGDICELQINNTKAKVNIGKYKYKKGMEITWVASTQDVYGHPDAYSLYGIQPYTGKLAARDPNNKGNVLEVIHSKNNKSQVVFITKIKNETFILMAIKKSLGNLQFKKNDTITWAEGKLFRDGGYAPIANPEKLAEMFIYGVGK